MQPQKRRPSGGDMEITGDQIFFVARNALPLIASIIALVFIGLIWERTTKEYVLDRVYCDDLNECTLDYKFHKGCTHVFERQNKECNATCYNGTAYCDGSGVCVGESCLGNCVEDEDCPLLMPDTVNATCVNEVCQWSLTIDDPITGNHSGIAGSYYETLCQGTVDSTSEFLDCVAASAVLSLDSQGYNTPGEIICILTFGCSTPVTEIP